MDPDNDLDGSPENHAQWKMSSLKGYTPYGSIYMTSLKWQKYRNGEQVSGCQELRKGGQMAMATKGPHEGSLG